MSPRPSKGHHHKRASRPQLPTITATKWCTGCSACVAVCDKRSAISMQPNAEGFLYPQIAAEHCNHCGKCYRKCPSAQIEQGKALLCPGHLAPIVPEQVQSGFTPRYFALSLKPDYKSLYGCATTGAAFRISYAFIKSGGLVCGCRFNYESAEAEHALAATVDELKAFCGSKYVQSNKHDVMDQVRAHLRAGRKVLFIGTPCEVSGLKQLLTEQEQLFTIDLICHGVPDPQSLKLYLKDLSSQIGPVHDLNFRAGQWTPAVLRAQGTKGTFSAEANNTHYYFAFVQGVNLRSCCYHCPYATITRVGDLTLGDFWGVASLIKGFPYPEAGVTAAIVSTSKGAQLINTLHYHTRHVYEVKAATMQASNISLRQPVNELPAARELYYQERERTQSVVASVNTVIARFGTKA